MAKDNVPDIIIRLVARNAMSCQVWADKHNEAFYVPCLFEESNEKPREVAANLDDTDRAVTPPSEGVKVSEPALQITFSNKPKNPELGYILGSDRDSCDVFLGTLETYISRNMFAIRFNEHNEVIMRSSSGNKTVVKYGGQTAERRNFTWLFPQEEEGEKKKEILVTTGGIKFSVEVPTHRTDKMAYEANCRNFMKQAKDAILTMNVLGLSTRPKTQLASGGRTSDATAEPPFYLRTGKLGEGGFGMVYKARSMPSGEVVAVKKFKSKNAWTLETDVLRKLSETPHDNIVEFIDFRTGDKPYLVMGFAVGGTLEQQCKTMPFNVTETTILLGQMLEALVYLHVEFGITHRDIKPANILCDSRTRCRLADFGLAKEGDVLKTFGGTQPYMAPEMFTRKPYTSAVDLWALGVVIAQLLSPSRPPGYRGDEGQRWCAAVIAQFRKYNEYFEALDFEAIDITYHEQKGLHLLVGTYLLKMNPDDRESASVCLEIWKHFCLTESVSNTLYVDHANGPSKSNASMKKNEASESYGALEEESAPEEGVIGPSEVNGSLRDNDSEADTEIPDERPPNSEEWLELEDEHPNNEANVVMIEDFSIDQEIDGGNGVKAPQDFVFNALANLSGLNWHPLFKESPHSASPAAPTGVRKSVHKRNASSIAKSVKAAAARQAAEDQS